MGRSESVASAASESPVAVRMMGVSKTFGGVRALDRVDLEVRHGEIHALLGENGAGKSTLLKILRGVLSPDAGTIEVDGNVLQEHTPEASRAAGVAMIFQEMSLVPTLTVAQNIFLNRELRDGLGMIDDRAAVRAARQLFDEFEVEIDPAASVSELGAGQRQLTEIVKAVSQRTRILVLDEPTSALTASEVHHLFDLLRRLKADGVAIVYVSHRMDEIMRVGDRATILRDGRHIVTAPLADLSLDQIIEFVIGRRSRGFGNRSDSRTSPGEPLLELRGASGERKPKDVDLVVRRGEVVGVAGLLGSGRSSLARLIYGIEPLSGGEIRVKGRPTSIGSPRHAMAAGIALIPEDRLRQGIIAQHSVASNLILSILDRVSRLSWISSRASKRLVDAQVTKMRIKTESAEAPVNSLSGGNQQKVVLGKWLAMEPDILILDEPTAGIDIGSKGEIIALIREMTRQGKGVLLISSEITELLAASDRIIVMSDGRVALSMLREDLDTVDPSDENAGEPARRAEHRLQVAIQEANAHG